MTKNANTISLVGFTKLSEEDFALRMTINPYGAIGFGLASVFAVTQEWSLPEFCWSTWLAGLVYAWSCVATASVQIILTVRSEKAAYEQHIAFLRCLIRISPSLQQREDLCKASLGVAEIL